MTTSSSQQWQPQPPQHWQPRANLATTTASENSSWLFNSGASHHVTTYLSNMFIHASYDNSDNIMIGDGLGLPITHTRQIKDGVYKWAVSSKSSPLVAFSSVKTTSFK
ncbi:Retrovirus-related Pol polyprotein from transposon RE1 [Vitis vinifera]|uniref:Retrovirus-related Pol polyprotein from transposon RE1 n=1 Tax=Vitis vinifera TaxID=29760 RepID=A0A438BYV7_VITVI|nr:Retrovirus-related Pol polyprotein from transposon RE1 [Vitis vinifera]